MTPHDKRCKELVKEIKENWKEEKAENMTRIENKKYEYLDQLVIESLERRKKVTLFLCKDEEGGFGIKVDGKIMARNLAWECLEIELGVDD